MSYFEPESFFLHVFTQLECGWVEEGDACQLDDDPHQGGVPGVDGDAAPNKPENIPLPALLMAYSEASCAVYRDDNTIT